MVGKPPEKSNFRARTGKPWDTSNFSLGQKQRESTTETDLKENKARVPFNRGMLVMDCS